jgi:acyl-coenzyme A thioesterase PaaI-like protein
MLNLLTSLPPTYRSKLMYFIFSKFKVPLIGIVGAKIASMDEKRVEIVVPLKSKNKNHLNAMYFGALCVGADVAGGILGVMKIFNSQAKVDLIFKDFTAKFLKRAESDVHFVCEDGDRIEQAVQETIRTKERVEIVVDVKATAPKATGEQIVATFQLTISMKVRKSKAA